MIKLIVSVDKNNGIGRNGMLLYKNKIDMRVFRKCTSEDDDNIILYGKNTLLSMPDSKPLPKRINIVITHNPEITADEYRNLDIPVGIITYNNKYQDVKITPVNNFSDEQIYFTREELGKHDTWLLFCKGDSYVKKLSNMGFSFWICGGESIYQQYLSVADVVVMTTFTRIEQEIKPTSFFDKAGIMRSNFIKLYSVTKRTVKCELQFEIFLSKNVVENIGRNYFARNDTCKEIAINRFNEYEHEIRRIMEIINNGKDV